MAVLTNTKKQEEQAQNTQQVQAVNPYTGLEGVSQNTANNLGNYQAGYTPNERVTQAQQTLQQVQSQKPQGYTNKYSGQLENILQQIQNPQDFKYEFNGDNLFKAYADLYTQKGKQASADVQAQAAGLTGGYGNSYGALSGAQAYQQYLLSLYDKGMDLRDRAYQEHRDKQGDLKDQYALLKEAEQTDYDRYRDTMGDWRTEEEQAYSRMNTAEENDYNQYMTELQYWTGLAQVENADYRSEQERQEAIRQYNQDFAENQRQFNENLAFDREKLAEQARQFDLDYELAKRKYEDELAAAQAAAAAASSGGRGGSSGGSGGSYIRLADNKYEDSKGNIVSSVPAGSIVHDGAYNAVTNAGKAIGNAAQTVANQITGSSLYQSASNLLNNLFPGKKK